MFLIQYFSMLLKILSCDLDCDKIQNAITKIENNNFSSAK